MPETYGSGGMHALSLQLQQFLKFWWFGLKMFIELLVFLKLCNLKVNFMKQYLTEREVRTGRY